MKSLIIGLLGLALIPVAQAGLSVEARIEQAMLGEHRSEANKNRNQYRHPVGTLSFLGVEDGMTVMEIWPGGGWYTEILAPVMRDHGKFIAATWDVSIPDQPGYRYRLQDALLKKFGEAPGIYDQVEIVGYSPPESASLGESESVDVILTFRNTHGWVGGGSAAEVFAEFERVLKPGGILGLVQHRAAEGGDPAETAANGYVSEQTVVDIARAAGLYLEASSEVNANPKDTRNHAEGVWSLPPGMEVCRSMEDESEKAGCEEKFMSIGESDRMTLRFRKPLK